VERGGAEGGSQGARLLQRVGAAQPTLTTALVSSANLDRELTNIRGGRLQRLLQPSLDTERRYVATAQAALRLALRRRDDKSPQAGRVEEPGGEAA